MKGQGFLANTQIVILGICIAAATIVSTVILSKGLMKLVKFKTEIVTVTGSAEKEIVSDFMVWKMSYSRRDPVMSGAYAKLKDDLKAVKAYLIDKGITADNIVVAPVSTEVLYKKVSGKSTNEIEGYVLSQEIEVRSYDVEKVTKISREATELIENGLEFVSNAPEYFYTKLAELKIEMLRAATKDAKLRAEEIAASSGNEIGSIRSAKMGVFQITPVNSYEVSSWGINDTSSLEKKVNSVVRAEFAIL